MTVTTLDQLLTDLNSSLSCNSDLQKKITTQLNKLTKETKKVQKTSSTTRRTTVVRKQKQDPELTDAEIDTVLNRVLDISYENLFNSSKTSKFNPNQKPSPPILCWSNLGLLTLEKLTNRGYFNKVELINIKWKFYWILSEVNTVIILILKYILY
jgi:hypothetical protein